MSYRICKRCRRSVPYANQMYQVRKVRRSEMLWSMTVCTKCASQGVDTVYHPVGFRGQEPSRLRHEAMVIMDERGHTDQEIGIAFGLDRSTVWFHLNGKCGCAG